MAYKQVRDVLRQIRDVYAQLREWYDAVEATTDDDRVRELMQYVSDHEQQLERALTRYDEENGGTNAVLDTWLQYTPDESLTMALKSIEIDPDMPPEEVMRSVQEFDRNMVLLYRELADQSSIERVRELFQNLLEFEQTLDQEYSWRMREFQGDSHTEPLAE